LALKQIVLHAYTYIVFHTATGAVPLIGDQSHSLQDGLIHPITTLQRLINHWTI